MSSLPRNPVEDPAEPGREELYERGVSAFLDIPDLAGRWLDALAEQDVLPTTDRGVSVGGLQVRRPVTENPANTSSDPSVSHAVLDNGETLWIRRARTRCSSGYRPVAVMNKLDRTIKAELAMLANLEGEKTDMPLQFARALLRYYRPNFENLPPEEQHTLLERCCDRVNSVLESTRLLAEFLEYGAPSRDQRPSFGDPQRDVEATMLKDVEGLTYSRIAEALGIAVPQRSYGAADYSSVGHMVKRGRGILGRAYGQQGWPDVAAEMRAELSRWEALGDKDRVVLRWSEAWRMDTQEVRDILEGARPDKSALYKIGSHYSVLTEIRDAFVNAQI